jgi:bifunctional enzyme CysN/CysC
MSNSAPSLQPSADEKMDIVFVGHVDHGKSTIVGRLLADTGSLPEGKLEQVRESCLRNSRPFEYAFLIDALKDERSQNITIDAARVFFKSARRHYIIIDAPGHIEFIKNMVTGASRAEAALLVIDAEEGVQENSRRHGYLLKMLGIRQIVVLINKMDLVGYRQETFESLQTEYGAYLAGIGVTPACFIPVSGREGDTVAALGAHMPWYQGPTVLQALDAFEKKSALVDRPLRIPVQDIYRFTLFGDDRRIVAGTISSGSLNAGDDVVFFPSGKRSKVKTIEAFNHALQTRVDAGQATGFTLEQQVYIQRGEIATRPGDAPPHVAKKIRASLFWLGKEPMVVRKQYLLKLGTARVKASIEKIVSVIDAASGQIIDGRNQIEHHEVAEVELTLSREMAFDLSETLSDTSRFVIVDQFEICGGGIILADIQDSETALREGVIQRNLRWIQGGVTPEQRSERYSQRPALVLITGRKGIGRKQVARDLENRLFQEGRHVYYLGFGSVIYGVDADLKHNGSVEVQREHVRRLAEVAHLLLDAGLILILTAVEFTQEDLKIMQTIIDARRIETVWVGDDVTTDLLFDLKIEERETAVTQIKYLLQEHGVIFRA